ncbi:class A beta-lactamase [Gluconacetobacter azotocaptans]|uniref:class A beta-lactamase n=1 Tax=Gluconacetobacter azotocaptans TaxID=142834 RepID=UPI00195B74BA|nr:class A beta-lactamase [Gluconacetobacter azotocaptans]MBM9401463.1 class A beta-lactamase [Gluconacetobacter azotocaptans]
MRSTLTRRSFGLCVPALIAARTAHAHDITGDTVAAIERRHGGRLGVWAVDTGSGRSLAHRADERFLMCSTFKGVLAALILSRVDAGRDSLSALVPYGEKDIVGHSPVSAAHVAQGALPVGTLCAAIVLYSDNGAANLLLARIGGPQALTAYMRTLGDGTTRSDRYEVAASRKSGDLDTTTPRAIVETARTILLGHALSPRSRTMLEGWMVACRTGSARLRAAFPPDWIAGDKTGTGNDSCNDYAIVRRAGRSPLMMACYYDAPGLGQAQQEAVLQKVGAAIVVWAG